MRALPCIAALSLILSQNALAHPHVFVEAKGGFYLNNSLQLEALRVVWRYDAFTTLFLFDALDLDIDSDGQLNEADLAAVVKAETVWPEGYNGDVHLNVAGQPQQFEDPTEAEAEMVNGEIVIRFKLPLTNPVSVEGESAVLRLYDPVYYYDYSVTADTSDMVATGNCDVVTVPFEPDSAEAATLAALSTLSREEAPTIPNIGALFADEVILTCD